MLLLNQPGCSIARPRACRRRTCSAATSIACARWHDPIPAELKRLQKKQAPAGWRYRKNVESMLESRRRQKAGR
jgi:hypothetical protein